MAHLPTPPGSISGHISSQNTCSLSFKAMVTAIEFDPLLKLAEEECAEILKSRTNVG